jgi:dipeptide/tripeptide permease
VALYQTAVFSSAFIGPIIGGYLADNFGFQFIFGISAFGRLLGMVVFAGLAVKLPVLKLRTFIHKI